MSFKNDDRESTTMPAAEATTAKVASALSEEGYQDIKAKLLAEFELLCEPIHGRIDTLKKENIEQ